MRVAVSGIRLAVLSVGLLASPLAATDAWADRTHNTKSSHNTVTNSVVHKVAFHAAPNATRSTMTSTVSHSAPSNKGHQTLLKGAKAQYGHRYGGGIQCVTFARANSTVQLAGNAANWWDAASGVYARGQQPERGSVLNFRANGHMTLGHVAVVSNVVGDREIEIDHANWAGPGVGRGGISRGVRVIDVSPNNDWSAVRVSLGQSGSYGSVYPTYGFIYGRPDTGATVQAAQRYDEIAEAPMRTLR